MMLLGDGERLDGQDQETLSTEGSPDGNNNEDGEDNFDFQGTV